MRFNNEAREAGDRHCRFFCRPLRGLLSLPDGDPAL